MRKRDAGCKTERICYMKQARSHKCRTCLWADQCGGEAQGCDDYSPIQDDRAMITYYEQELKWRAEDYLALIREFEEDMYG